MLTGVSACGPGSGGERPNVVLISLDTFRADALGVNGGGVNNGSASSLTPHLDALAEESINFRNAFAQLPHTLPSHASLLTGLYPDTHGVKNRSHRLSSEMPTLASLLRDQGYRTAGVVSSIWLKEKFGLAAGLENHTFVRSNRAHFYADRVNKAAQEQLLEWRDATQPFFLFLHYYDAHSDFGKTLPYASPKGFRQGPLAELDYRDFCTEEGECATRYLFAADQLGREIPDEELARIVGLYHAGVRYLDLRLGHLFAMLRQSGVYEDSLIVVTADHGEAFREHGRFVHSDLYDQTMGVPLIIKLPRAARGGSTVQRVVETVDVLPTILEAVGVEIPAYVQGTSRLGAHEDREADEGVAFGQHKLDLELSVYSVRTHDYKLVYDIERQTAELYDLARDPEEQLDVSSERQDVVRRLTRLLQRQLQTNQALALEIAGHEGKSATALTAAEERQLKALGYLD